MTGSMAPSKHSVAVHTTWLVGDSVTMVTISLLQFTPPTYTHPCKHFSLVPRPCLAFHHLQYGKVVNPFFLIFIQARGEPGNKATNVLISWESTLWTQRFCIGWKYHLDSYSFSFVWTACIPTPNYILPSPQDQRSHARHPQISKYSHTRASECSTPVGNGPRSQAPPSFPSILVQKSGRGPGIFSHMSDVRIERV